MPEHPSAQPGPPDLREYFAAERTILAYVRTGLAMMGIGFVVARFGLILRMMPVAGQAREHTSISLWLGVALIGLGTVVTVMAAAQYARQVAGLNAFHGHQVRASRLAQAIALTLGAFGVAMALYLVQNAR